MAVVDGGGCLMQRVRPSIDSNVALPRKMPAQRDDYCLHMQTMHTYIYPLASMATLYNLSNALHAPVCMRTRQQISSAL